MERRNFLKRTAAAGLGISLMGRSGLAMQAKGGAKLRKALQIGMLPNNLSDADKFKLAKKCGYEGIEGNPMADLDAAKELGKLARDAGLVTGDLKRAKRKEAAKLEKLRKDYLKLKAEYFKALGSFAVSEKVSQKNMDYFESLSAKFAEKNPEIKKLKEKFTQVRQKYVDMVTDLMYELYSDKWFNQ